MNNHKFERQTKVEEQEAALGFSGGPFGGYTGLDSRSRMIACSRRMGTQMQLDIIHFKHKIDAFVNGS